MKTDRARVWLLGGGVVAALVLVLGWLLLVSPQRARAADLNSQADQTTAANVSLAAQVVLLKREFAQLPATQATLAQYSQKIPTTAAISSLLRQLAAAAVASHVNLTAVSPSTPTPLVAASTKNLLASNVNLTLTGHYAQVEALLTRLEGLRRSFLVTGLSISKGGAPSAGSGGAPTGSGTPAVADPNLLQVNISGRVFVAVPGGTTPSSAATPSTTGKLS